MNDDDGFVGEIESEEYPGRKRDLGWIFRSILILGVSTSVLCIVIAIAAYWHFSKNLPKIISVSDYRPLGVTRVIAYDSDQQGKEGTEIGEFSKEKRYLIPYQKIPDTLVRAFISAEDDRFFEHPGINIISILRASIANFKAGHVVQGGSTITQQVAKSLLLTSERSFDRKIKEVILASRIERNLTKQQILYLYLNQIYLGHGAYGVQAACKLYFQKDVSEVTLAESALLAGMPQAPGKYSPLISPKKAKERQIYVLRRMFENNYITQVQMTEAAAQPLKIYRDEDVNKKYAPYLVEFVRKYLVEKYGEKAVYEDGLTVLVPARPDLAIAAQKSVREGLLAVDKRMGYRGPVQHLKDPGEVENYLKEVRAKLIEKKVPFQLFMPDGRIDAEEAIHFAGIQSELDLLTPGELYPAVVTGFDNTRKIAKLLIGSIRAELSIDHMRWARPAKDEQKPLASRPEPYLPSRTFQKGDVILVSLLNSNNPTSPSREEVQVALEQEPLIQGALLSMDVKTGHVLAMVGGYDFAKSEFNRSIQALRQPGSAFKPVIYGAALEKGFNPASIIVDSPIVFKDNDGTSSWKPNNFEEKFYGDTTFRQALIKSRNIPTIKIVQAITVPYLIEYARRLGLNAAFNQDLSISLGSASIGLLELTKVFALYPRLGKKVMPIFMTKILDRDGRVLEEAVSSKSSVSEQAEQSLKGQPDPMPSPQPSAVTPTFLNYPLVDHPEQVLDPRVAYVMTHLMTEVVTYGTGHEAKNLGRPAAGKTGTTNDSNDAWFIGFTPYVLTSVWAGFDSQKSIGPGETGAKVALPIWLSFMKEAVKSYPPDDFIVPPGIVFADIDSNTGKLTNAKSPTAIREAFIEGTQPTAVGVTSGNGGEIQSDFFKEDTE